MPKEIKNIEASVRERLCNVAKKEKKKIYMRLLRCFAPPMTFWWIPAFSGMTEKKYE